MTTTSITGGQWGDEGKGKIVDLLSKNVEIVARYQGGANAGHTVYIGSTKIVLHQIPSGILRPNCHCILGNGMVIDPIGLVDEIEMLESFKIKVQGRILIAYNAHFVTPIHKAIDKLSEEVSEHPIGTTCKGIGPTYVDKYNRRGIRGHDLMDLNNLAGKLEFRLQKAIDHGELSQPNVEIVRKEFDQYILCVKKISEMITDTFTMLHQHNKRDSSILVEGAQGTMLDIDHGSYPFVTSSNPSTGGISTGLGLPLTDVDRRIGIFKAYTTRVGEGPFPTELNDDIGIKLQKTGNEYGATTGRPRRCGWFDGILAKYSAMVNGFNEIALTKMDVLDTFDEIKVCTAYQVDGVTLQNLSVVIYRLEDVIPVYESLKGWEMSTTEIEHYDELPLRAQQYIQFLSEVMETPVKIISVGPERNQIISR